MRLIVSIVLAVFVCGCGDTNVWIPTAPTAPTAPAVAAVVRSTIAFRVFGNASQVRVRYSTPIDGLTQVTTSLPYSNTFTTADASMFLSLEATPLIYPVVLSPFLSVSIVVDGVLFREATSNDFTNNTLAISGTWRR